MIRFASLVLFISALSFAAIKPVGNAKAPKGGTFTVGLNSYPKHLLLYLANEEVSQAIDIQVLETLMEYHPETYELVPLLAEDWKVSKDKKTFTIKLNPKATFSDGKPLTAEDVKFTWDTVMNPKNQTVPFQSYYESFESCTVKDTHTLEFKVRTVHFKNLPKLGEFMVLPKHVYSTGDFNKAYNNILVGSGPYIVSEAKTGEKVTLTRNENYWGKDLPLNIGRNNFGKLVYKSVPDYNVGLEQFKRGDIDYFYFLVSKMWATQTDGPLFQNNYIKKIRGENSFPFGMQGFAWNMRKPLFQDAKVRRALTHAMDRERYIRDLFYGQYIVSTGIVSPKSEYHSPNNKPIPYDPKKAKALLKEAGWDKTDSDGILIKDGKRFEFEVLCENPALTRFLTVVQEDFKKMGVKMSIRPTDWATFIKLMDDRQFDVVAAARSRMVEPSDFSNEWGMKEADLKGSNNVPGYKNEEVDALTKKIDTTFEKKERLKLVRRLDEIISQDQPYSFTYEATYFRVAHWNRFGFQGKGYFNYSNWRDTFQYWWFDEKKNEQLKTAMNEGKSLP